MNIDASLRDLWTPTDDGTYSLTLPTGWMQGRSMFGGLTAAAMASLGHRSVEDEDRALRTASVQLLAPLTPGVVSGSSTILREGRNITFVEVRLEQDDVLVGRTTLVFAKPRESALDVHAPRAAKIDDPESLTRMPYIEGVVPEFTQNVDMRWADGRPPFMGASEAKFTGVFRYLVPLGDSEGLLALLDTYPPPTLSLAKTPTFASTVSWSAHLLVTPASFEDWFTVQYETLVGAHGLHTSVAKLHDAEGTLLAWSEQLVAVFG
ncbi:MAG: acyl-CoA thioesterase [Nannocystaceae bacterium]|nr:thioesterase family protein [bacterium]